MQSLFRKSSILYHRCLAQYSSVTTLLYNNPENKPSEKSTIDIYTLVLALNMAKFKAKGVVIGNSFEEGYSTKGFHFCTGDECDARSACYDILLPNGFATNTLALHYVMYHRAEVPQEDLDKIKKMGWPSLFD